MVDRRTGGAVGCSLHGVDDGVEPGRGGQMRRQADRELRVEQHEIRLQRRRPVPVLDALVRGEDRNAGRFRPGAGRRRDRDQWKPVQWKGFRGQPVARQRAGAAAGDRHDLGRIECRPAAERDDCDAAALRRHGARRLDLRFLRIGGDVGEGGRPVAGSSERGLRPLDEAEGPKARIGDEEHRAAFDARAGEFGADRGKCAGFEADCGHTGETEGLQAAPIEFARPRPPAGDRASDCGHSPRAPGLARTDLAAARAASCPRRTGCRNPPGSPFRQLSTAACIANETETVLHAPP